MKSVVTRERKRTLSFFNEYTKLKISFSNSRCADDSYSFHFGLYDQEVIQLIIKFELSSQGTELYYVWRNNRLPKKYFNQKIHWTNCFPIKIFEFEVPFDFLNHKNEELHRTMRVMIHNKQELLDTKVFFDNDEFKQYQYICIIDY